MHARGFSLVEMMVVVAIAAVVLGIAVPQFDSMIVGARVRRVAESIQGGLLLARSEAIRRNAPMRFQLVSSLDNACATSSTAIFWVVTQYTDVNSRGEPFTKCAANPYMPADQSEPCPAALAYTGTAASCAADPFIAHKSSSEAAASVSVASVAGIAPVSVVTFGPLGQLLDNLAAANARTTGANVAYATLVSSTAAVTRSYQVQVNANGGVKLCNPNAAAPDPAACPT